MSTANIQHGKNPVTLKRTHCMINGPFGLIYHMTLIGHLRVISIL